MNTTRYLDILNRTADRLLLNRSTLFTTSDWYPLRTFHSERLREAWEQFWWPDLMRIEEFTHGGAAIGFDDGTADIGTVESVWSSDPLESTTAVEVPYTITEDGIVIMSDDDPVYVRFRLPAPELTGDVWDASTAYTAGEQVFYSTDFYDVVTTTTAGESPATAAASFRQVEIPEYFADYLQLGAAADFERSRKQMDTASIYESKADLQLANRQSLWTAGMNQFPRVKVYRT